MDAKKVKDSIKKITITGLAGVGKGTTASMLAEGLGWEYYSAGNFFRGIAKEMGVSLYELEDISKKDSSIDIRVEKRAENLGKTEEGFVYEGRLGWYFIQGAFNIKLVCEDDERFRRIQERENKPIEKIKEETLHRERAINIRFRKIFGIDDWIADDNYDLVVDTTNIPPKDVVEEILKAITED